MTALRKGIRNILCLLVIFLDQDVQGHTLAQEAAVDIVIVEVIEEGIEVVLDLEIVMKEEEIVEIGIEEIDQDPEIAITQEERDLEIDIKIEMTEEEDPEAETEEMTGETIEEMIEEMVIEVAEEMILEIGINRIYG